MSRILVIEDEAVLLRGLSDLLSARGYQVDGCDRGDTGLTQAESGVHDLILLDAMLPGLSGFDIIRRLRARGMTTPVLMLTARSEEVDRVLGFELGVDDYVTKPFSLLELLGRIQAILRRVQARPAAAAAAPLRFGATEVDLERYTAHVNGQPAPLPSKGFDILKALYRNRGQVVHREALLDQVWGQDEYPSQRTLNNIVVKIRQVIEANPDAPVFLKTVHGVGYRLDV